MKSKKKYLIDTHVFLWAIDGVDKLSKVSLEILENSSSEIYLSRCSYWEICLKISTGKLKLGSGWEKSLEKERKKNRFHWLEITSLHCEGIINLPNHHKDPFDRMLVSQAISENMILITCDEKIAKYDLNVAW